MNNKINNKFIPWFIGFCDAECSFITNLKPRKNKNNIITSYGIFYRIQIVAYAAHIKDKPILEYINENIGNIGTIYNYPDKEESTLCVISHGNLNKIIDNIFSKHPLLTSYQASRYANLKKGLKELIINVKSAEEFNLIFNSKITPSVLGEENCSNFYLDHWLVGFLNGEVSFLRFKGKAGNFKPKVSLEHTDELALNFFKSHLLLGPKVLKLKQRENRKITYRIDITSVNDLNKIIEFLDRTDSLRGNKLEQYKEWKNNYFNLTP
uniref:Putative LAGLIDADG homing endonuclease n=1 Tax=Aleurobotrys botryosus TaxID=68789 RepID=H1ZWQ8_9AGAM|nr:putative LAGLIDADG homing endonuclease [Aleurobotrys botryosus]